MKKIIELPERFPTGEPTMLAIAHWSGGRHLIEKKATLRAFGVGEKYASEAFDYVAHVTPRAGETMVLVNALGVFEKYDDNRNGDAFNEEPYRVGVRPSCGCDQCRGRDPTPGWISRDEIVTKHYESFENGGIYQHHVNKDPTKSLGRVEKAFWNAQMHRVELLLALVNARCPEWVQEIEDGVYAPVSMGCHVRWDVCANCGHRAPTRKDYCEHLKWGMRQIDPVTGVRNCALNPSARFFDISKVFRPADPQGFMIKKVAEAAYEVRGAAELGEKVAAYEAKQAQIRKLSDIQKVIVGEIEHAKLDPARQLMQRYRHNALPETVVALPPAGLQETDAMAAHAPAAVTSTLAEKGAGLSAGELFAVLYKRAGLGTADDDLLDRAVALQPLVTAFFARYPAAAEKMAAVVAPDPARVSPQLAAQLGGWLDKRAGIADFVGGALGRSGLPGTQWLRDREPPKTDVLYVTDPNTGARYTTTRGAAMAAHDEDAKADLVRRAGTTLALTGAARLALGRMVPGVGQMHGLVRHGVPLAAGAYGAHKLMDRYPKEPQMLSDEGYAVPATTEMLKESAANFAPAISPTRFLDLLAFDYVERLGPEAKLAADMHLQLLGRIARRCGPASPVLRGYPLEEKVAALFSDLELRSGDPTDPPEIDLDAACHRLGLLLVI